MNDYLCCKGVKGATFGPIFHTQFVDKWHVWFVGLCVDGSANYSSQVLHVAYLPISGPYFSRCVFLTSKEPVFPRVELIFKIIIILLIIFLGFIKSKPC